jgi:hypothetical protein
MVTISVTDKEQIAGPGCGAPMLETRNISGYLYILTNPSMPGLVKIGITTRTVDDRLSELNSATGVPDPFAVEAYFESSNPLVEESAVHTRLALSRVSGKEFFRMTLAEALTAARVITGREPLVRMAQASRSTKSAMPTFLCSARGREFRSTSDKCPHCGSSGQRWWGKRDTAGS